MTTADLKTDVRAVVDGRVDYSPDYLTRLQLRLALAILEQLETLNARDAARLRLQQDGVLS